MEIEIEGRKVEVSNETVVLALQEHFAKHPLTPEPKPELRHGDYGCDENGRLSWIKIYGNVWWLDGRQKTPSGCEESSFVKEKKGNIKDIFDDLERNKVDLEEFEKASSRTNGNIKFHIDADPHLIWFESECGYFNIEEATKIHQKLGQMIATAKRKSK